jgi:hypothetical protein
MHEMNNNEKLERLLKNDGLQTPYMTRYSYIIENAEGKFLVVKSVEGSFPVITFGNKWQILSESYYYCDMFDEDIFTMAAAYIKNETSIETKEENLKLVSYATYSAETNYAAETSFLNLYFYLKLKAIKIPSFCNEDYEEYKWLEKGAAILLINLANDLKALEQLETEPKSIL